MHASDRSIGRARIGAPTGSLSGIITRIAWALLGAVWSVALPAAAEETVKLAYLAPLSGSNALVFEEGLRIFRAAADAANAREAAAGFRIEIVPFDNKGTAQDSLIMLRQALDQDIRFVTATISSVAGALSEAVLKHNQRNPDKPVLFLNYDARDPALTEERCHFWHFRFEPHTDMQVKALVAVLAKQPDARKLYMINPDYAWGHSVQKAARQGLKEMKLDLEIVGDDLVPLAKVKDFSPYVAKVRASGADTVLTGNWGQDLTLFVKAAHEASLKARLLTTHAWVLGTPAAIGGAGENRVSTMTAWHINAGPASWEQRMVQAEKQFHGISHMDFLPIWTTVDMFARALAVAGSSNPNKVAYALEGMEYDSPGSRAWMRKEDHQMISGTYVASFAKVGSPGVKYEEEGTGFGWKTEVMLSAKDSVPPLRCKMERP